MPWLILYQKTSDHLRALFLYQGYLIHFIRGYPNKELISLFFRSLSLSIFYITPAVWYRNLIKIKIWRHDLRCSLSIYFSISIRYRNLIMSNRSEEARKNLIINTSAPSQGSFDHLLISIFYRNQLSKSLENKRWARDRKDKSTSDKYEVTLLYFYFSLSYLSIFVHYPDHVLRWLLGSPLTA